MKPRFRTGTRYQAHYGRAEDIVTDSPVLQVQEDNESHRLTALPAAWKTGRQTNWMTFFNHEFWAASDTISPLNLPHRGWHVHDAIKPSPPMRWFLSEQCRRWGSIQPTRGALWTLECSALRNAKSLLPTLQATQHPVVAYPASSGTYPTSCGTFPASCLASVGTDLSTYSASGNDYLSPESNGRCLASRLKCATYPISYPKSVTYPISCPNSVTYLSAVRTLTPTYQLSELC